MEIVGYFGALLIGLVLGLLGGGGSILTVPIMHYILGYSAVTSTAYSLFVVGSSALVGAGRNAMKGMVDFKTGIVFSIPAFITVYLTRKYLVPAIPSELFSVGDFVVTKSIALMVFFAIVMILASYTMIKGRKESTEQEPIKNYHFKLVIQGIFIGIISGLVGAGGGFLIIPALVLMARLPMKRAVATSLMIIAINSLIGFLGDVQNIEIDWSFLLVFTSLSIIGIFIGIYLNKFIDGKKLKKGFGWFVLVMGIYIVLKEIVLTK